MQENNGKKLYAEDKYHKETAPQVNSIDDIRIKRVSGGRAMRDGKRAQMARTQREYQRDAKPPMRRAGHNRKKNRPALHMPSGMMAEYYSA